MSYSPYSVYKAERLLRRRRRWLLLGVVGLLVTVGVAVGGSLLWGYVQWQKTQIDDPGLTAALGERPVNNLYPAPEGTTNILILGIDNRGWEMIRSDSMILVHIDPGNNYLSAMSLPRDLYVEVPGNGMQKLNFAYAKGGYELALKTVENLTGVDVTQYLEIDLEAFEGLTDALGGVYLDVDKHYLQNTDPAKEPADIPMGYQLLDGAQALDYVRFRNDDNMDFGRQARQQRFLAALREQSHRMNMTELPGLITTMTDNIKTTIGYNDVLSLAYWALTGDMSIRQVVVTGSSEKIDGVFYVVADEASLSQKIQDFATAPSGAGAVSATVTQDTTAATPTTAAPQAVSVDSSQFITNPLSIPNAAMYRQLAQEMPFKVMAPGYVPAGYVYFDKNPQTGAGYAIDTGGEPKKGLKLIYQLQVDGTPKPQYLGIMETDWLEAPAASPGRQVAYNGVTYTVVGTYDQTERVWWQKDGVLYWVSNTIMHYLDADELIKVAASMMTIDTGLSQ